MSRRLNEHKIREYLVRVNKRREWLAAELGVSGSLMNQMLAGKVPKTETLFELADLMECRAEDLLLSIEEAKETA